MDKDDFGRIRIPESELPQAKNWQVGSKYTLSVVVEQTGVNKERDYGTEIGVPTAEKKEEKPKHKVFYEFRIKEVEPSKVATLKEKAKNMAKKV